VGEGDGCDRDSACRAPACGSDAATRNPARFRAASMRSSLVGCDVCFDDFDVVALPCQGTFLSPPFGGSWCATRVTQGLLRVALGYILPLLRGSQLPKCVALCGS